MPSQSPPDIGECLREGWAVYRREPALLSVATLIAMVISAIASQIPFAGLLLGPPLLGGLYLLIMRIAREEDAAIGNLFDGFGYFLPLVIAGVAMSLIVIVGLLLLVIPGLYFALAYGFTTLLIVDRRLEFWPAMERSRRTITAHFWDYLLLVIVLIVVLMVASIPFGLGLPIAIPFCLAAQYIFYREVMGSGDEGDPVY